MSKLIEALTIFLKYGDPPHPTHCEHDELFVMIDPAVVSEADGVRLSELGFEPIVRDSCFRSLRYGSA